MMDTLKYNATTLEKFTADKKMLYFPGVTIVYNFTDPELIKAITEIVRAYKKSRFAAKLVFLPEDSFHMTIASIIAYKKKYQDRSLSDFPALDKDLAETDSFIVNALRDEEELDVEMVIERFTESKIIIKPRTPHDERVLKDYRKRIYRKLGIGYDDDYLFHISVSYTLIDFDGADEREMQALNARLLPIYAPMIGTIHIDAAQLSFFNDMSEFRHHTQGRDRLGVCGF